MVLRSIKVGALIGMLASVAFAGTAPRLQGIIPAHGPTAGGTLFRIRGIGFDALPAGTLGVLFGDVPAIDVTKTDDREIRGTSPAHVEGTVDVVLSIDGVAYPDPGTDHYRFSDGPNTCTTAEECDDLNPCTANSCTGFCQSVDADSPDDLTGGAPACAGLTVPKKVGKKFLAGCKKLVQRASAPNERKQAKLKTKAIKSFTKAETTVGKAQALAGECATELGAILQSARGYAEGL